MSEQVKRYTIRAGMPETAELFLPPVVVSASDYDALAQRCRELELKLAGQICSGFALAQVDKTQQRELDDCLSRGIAAVEAERDTMAQRCRELEANFAELADTLGKLQTGEDGIVARVTSERDTLRAEVERLQAMVGRQEQQIAALTADPNGWQAGYDKGRQDGTKTRLSELEQERRINRELRDRLREQREDYAVGAALQRAAGELPEGFEIRVEVEYGAGSVRLYGPEGDEIEGIEGDTLADEINEAIDAAMESQACANTAGSSPRT